jgi:hypothetical protein
MLGNLARSDYACEEFVHTSQVHKPLIAILVGAHDSQILHAALGFLKNLAMPMKNKEALGEAGLMEALPRLWILDTLQQIQFSSISLARQLIIGTINNVRRIVSRPSKDIDSPANMRSKISLLIALFDRTDVEPIKIEISRLLTAVCRVFNTHHGRAPKDMELIRKEFFTMHHDIAKPLGFMVSQTKWPAVRSEGWFVFALMARHPEGAQCISDLMEDFTVFQPLVEMLTGRTLLDRNPGSLPTSEISEKSPASASGDGMSSAGQAPDSAKPTNPGEAQETDMARIDKENALVLIIELLKNRGGEMTVVKRSMFEELLNGATKSIMSYMKAAANRSGDSQPQE